MRPAATGAPTTAPRSLLGVLVAAVLLVAAGCGSGGGSGAASPQPSGSVASHVTVTGAFGARPTLTISSPLKVAKTSSWTLTRGTGTPVTAAAQSILQLTLADARTGKTAISTADTGQRPLVTALSGGIFPSLATSLTGRRVGSRIVIASTAADSYGTTGSPQLGIRAGDPVVMVADILATDPPSVLKGPTGASYAAPAKAPKIVVSKGQPSSFDLRGLRKPAQLEVFKLREGTGAPLTGARRVAVNYVGQVWGAAKPFAVSYRTGPQPFSIGVSGVIPAWDKALAGVRAGARVLLVAPPGSAYGSAARGPIPANSTLIFVIDVLGVD